MHWYTENPPRDETNLGDQRIEKRGIVPREIGSGTGRIARIWR
jgi:hypothetical protein